MAHPLAILLVPQIPVDVAPLDGLSVVHTRAPLRVRLCAGLVPE